MIGPEVTVPDVTEHVIGYRKFLLSRKGQHNFTLVSPHQGTEWPSPAQTAKCSNVPVVPEGLILPVPLKPHSAPHKGCGCGIYAYFEPCPVADRDRYGSFGYLSYGALSLNPNVPTGSEVEALMVLDGRLEVHARGMRAERASIAAIGLNKHLGADEVAALREIGKRWDIPVVPQERLPALGPEFGRPLDESMRPEAKPPVPAAPALSPGMPYFATTTNSTFVNCEMGPPRPVPRRTWIDYIAPVVNGGLAAMNATFFGLTGNPFSLACIGINLGAAIVFRPKAR